MLQAALPQAGGKQTLDPDDQPRYPVGDHRQRRSQPAVHQLADEPSPGVVAVVAARRQSDQYRAALGGDPPGAQHRLGPSAGVHTQMATAQHRDSSSIALKERFLPSIGSRLHGGSSPS
jgi:hypothetical protein